MSNAIVMAPLPIAAVTASATVLGPAANLASDYMGVVWSAAGAAQSIIVDMGANVAIDTIALLGMANASAGATMTIAAATDAQGSGFAPGAFWTGAAQALYAGGIRLVNGFGIGLWTGEAGMPVAARYWRISFASLGAGGIQLSRVAIGKRLALQRNFSLGAARGIRDFGQIAWSPRGVMLRRRSKKLRTIGLSFSSVFRDEVENQVAPLIEDRGITDPVLVVTDAAADTNRERRTYFGPMANAANDPGFVQRRADGFEWRVDVISLA